MLPLIILNLNCLAMQYKLDHAVLRLIKIIFRSPPYKTFLWCEFDINSISHSTTYVVRFMYMFIYEYI